MDEPQNLKIQTKIFQKSLIFIAVQTERHFVIFLSFVLHNFLCIYAKIFFEVTNNILCLCFIILCPFATCMTLTFKRFWFEVINYYINTPTSFKSCFLFSRSVRLDKNQKLINYVAPNKICFIMNEHQKRNLLYTLCAQIG